MPSPQPVKQTPAQKRRARAKAALAKARADAAASSALSSSSGGSEGAKEVRGEGVCDGLSGAPSEEELERLFFECYECYDRYGDDDGDGGDEDGGEDGGRGVGEADGTVGIADEDDDGDGGGGDRDDADCAGDAGEGDCEGDADEGDGDGGEDDGTDENSTIRRTDNARKISVEGSGVGRTDGGEGGEGGEGDQGRHGGDGGAFDGEDGCDIDEGDGDEDEGDGDEDEGDGGDGDDEGDEGGDDGKGDDERDLDLEWERASRLVFFQPSICTELEEKLNATRSKLTKTWASQAKLTKSLAETWASRRAKLTKSKKLAVLDQECKKLANEEAVVKEQWRKAGGHHYKYIPGVILKFLHYLKTSGVCEILFHLVIAWERGEQRLPTTYAESFFLLALFSKTHTLVNPLRPNNFLHALLQSAFDSTAYTSKTKHDFSKPELARVTRKVLTCLLNKKFHGDALRLAPLSLSSRISNQLSRLASHTHALQCPSCLAPPT